MGMSIEEIRYRLQAMVTMCTFQDAVGHDLSYKEIKLYNQAKDEAISTMRKYQRIEQILKEPCIIPEGCYPMLKKIKRVVEDGENDN